MFVDILGAIQSSLPLCGTANFVFGLTVQKSRALTHDVQCSGHLLNPEEIRGRAKDLYHSLYPSMSSYSLSYQTLDTFP